MKVDNAERNYIFGREVTLHKTINNVLNRNPVLALTSAWKYKFHRSGLSPFVLGYLIDPEMPLEKLMKKYFGTRLVHYGYCYSTSLPVVFPRIRFTWDNPNVGGLPTYFPRDRWERAERRDENLTRNSRFKVLAQELKEAKEAGLDDDDFMRKFGRNAIPIGAWKHLKGVAEIYKP